MSKLSIRWVVALAAAVVMSLATVNFAAAPCANLTVSANPTIVAQGGTVTVTGSINNCSRASEKVTVKYEASGPCGTVEMGSIKLNLSANETRTASVSYAAPACPGEYTLTATALSGSTVLTTSSITVTVQ
jgi:uncharacterized membrane protein